MMTRAQLEHRILSEIQYRTIEIRQEGIDQANRTVELAFSSELPVDRWWGTEILDHKPSSVRMDRLQNAAPLLWGHDSWESKSHIGVIEIARIDKDKVGRSVVRFSRNPEADIVFRDVVDGIRKKVSVGYRNHKLVLESEEEGHPTYRIMDWEPIEISIVSIAQDDTVGVGRGMNQDDKNDMEAEIDKRVRARIKEVLHEETKITLSGEVSKMPNINLNEEKKPTPEELAQREKERKEEIEVVAKRYADRVDKKWLEEASKAAIDLKVPAEQFRGDVYLQIKDTEPIETPKDNVGMSQIQLKDKLPANGEKVIGAMPRERDLQFVIHCI